MVPVSNVTSQVPQPEGTKALNGRWLWVAQSPLPASTWQNLPGLLTFSRENGNLYFYVTFPDFSQSEEQAKAQGAALQWGPWVGRVEPERRSVC
jgi:hypothetical protein